MNSILLTGVTNSWWQIFNTDPIQTVCVQSISCWWIWATTTPNFRSVYVTTTELWPFMGFQKNVCFANPTGESGWLKAVNLLLKHLVFGWATIKKNNVINLLGVLHLYFRWARSLELVWEFCQNRGSLDLRQTFASSFRAPKNRSCSPVVSWRTWS